MIPIQLGESSLYRRRAGKRKAAGQMRLGQTRRQVRRKSSRYTDRTPAGNIPKREKDAAADIFDATGIKPTMVPVRPLPPPKPACPNGSTCQ